MLLYLHYLVVITLVSMGVIHFSWALGGKFLLDAAIPTKDGTKLLNPGLFLTFLVGFILLGFAFVVWEIKSEDAVYLYLNWAIATLFGIRAIGDFNMVGFFKKIKHTKFALYDTKYFSPLCLTLSLSLVVLIFT